MILFIFNYPNFHSNEVYVINLIILAFWLNKKRSKIKNLKKLKGEHFRVKGAQLTLSVVRGS